MYGLKSVRNRRSDALSRVAWDRLESLLAIYYRGQGYRVEHCGTGVGGSRFDGGIDLKLFKDGEYIVVQCKHWNAKQVPHNDVHQLLGIMLNEGATGAILVSSGEFTAYARESAAKQGRVQLVDGDALRTMIGPLPEEVGDTNGFADSKAGAIASHVGERLLSAAEDRIRGRGRKDKIGAGLAFKAIAPLIGLLIAMLMINHVIDSVGSIKTHPRPANPVSIAEPLPAPVTNPMPAPVLPSASMPRSTMSSGLWVGTSTEYRQGRAVTNPCHELIDRKSGTYIDHCAMRTPSPPPSDADIRDSRRKADEAIKVLEASTPEVYPQ